jgi:hypothetical protein
MTAPHTARHDTSPSFNHLRRSATYRITTTRGTSSGEYLGMETPHGDRAILLRHMTGTESIPLREVTSIRRWAQRARLCAVR